MKRFRLLLLFIGLHFGISDGNAQSWWDQTSNTTIDLHSVIFSDASNGYVFGDTLSTVVNTGNAGSTWSVLSSVYIEGDYRSSAYLGSNSEVIAVGFHDSPNGEGVVAKTTNSGATWSIDSNIPEKIFDVDFVNANDGWIVGRNGYIARSGNGGNSWTPLMSGTGEHVMSVSFINATEGWAVGAVDSVAIILHTSNAGTNWSIQNNNSFSDLFAVDFVSNQIGWAVGADGVILSTTDGGAVWSAQTSGTLNDLNDVTFLDAGNGWAVGDGGTILTTVDSGATWTAEASGITTDINSITMLNDNLGWLCGDGGVVKFYGLSPTTIEGFNMNSAISVYPNPASEHITIINDGLEGNWTVVVYDMLGNIVISELLSINKIMRLGTEALSPGLYVVEINSDYGERSTKKLLIE